MANQPRRQFYANSETFQDIASLVREVQDLRRQLDELKGVPSALKPAGLSHAINIPAASDPNATAQVYGAGFNPNVPITAIDGGSTGYSFSMSGTTYTMAVSNAATARSAISAAAKQAVAAGTVTLLKLTGPGANGSITITAEGTISAYTAPT